MSRTTTTEDMLRVIFNHPDFVRLEPATFPHWFRLQLRNHHPIIGRLDDVVLTAYELLAPVLLR